MSSLTPNLLLKTWEATDQKLQTWQDYNDNLTAIDLEITELKTTNILWSGAAYPAAPPASSGTITPSKPLSQCRNGWILVWSDYDPGVGANDFDIAYSIIPKGTPFLGKSHDFAVPNNATSTNVNTIVKKLTVNDTTLVGSDDNSVATTNTNDVVLRNVLEF